MVKSQQLNVTILVFGIRSEDCRRNVRIGWRCCSWSSKVGFSYIGFYLLRLYASTMLTPWVYNHRGEMMAARALISWEKSKWNFMQTLLLSRRIVCWEAVVRGCNLTDRMGPGRENGRSRYIDPKVKFELRGRSRCFCSYTLHLCYSSTLIVVRWSLRFYFIWQCRFGPTLLAVGVRRLNAPGRESMSSSSQSDPLQPWLYLPE